MGPKKMPMTIVSIDSDTFVPRTHRKTSPVWQYFEHIGNNTKEARCDLCKDILRHHGNTTNLAKHLKNRHRSEALMLFGEDAMKKHRNRNKNNNSYKESPRRSLPVRIDSQYSRPQPSSSSKSRTTGISTLGSMLVKTEEGVTLVKPQQNSSRNNSLDHRVMMMIVMDLQPVSIVESKSFVDLMKLADPRYSLPSRETIISDILPKLYQDAADQIFKIFDDIKHVALSTEFWTPRHHESYLAVTVHFISPTTWTHQSVLLSTIVLYGNPDGEHIAAKLKRTVDDWNLVDKVQVMVADNETNRLLASTQLPWAYVPCLAHLMHMVVTDSISGDAQVTALIDKTSNIVQFFKEETEAKVSLEDAQKALELPVNKLLFYVPTRWNSMYFMLQRMLEQVDAVNTVLSAYNKDDMRLSSEDEDNLKTTVASLKPFEIASKTMSSEKSTSIGTAMPLVKGLLKMMGSFTDGKEPLTSSLTEGLATSFGKIEEIDWVVAATVLDPRFKKFPYADKEVIEKATKTINEEITSMCQSETDASSSKDAEDSLWMYLDGMTNSAQETGLLPPAASYEFQRYLESPPISGDDNPLFYWRQHEELFPTLSQLVLKYMTVPITSIPCERLFSKAGDSLVQKRANLKAKYSNMILFLNSNMPFLKMGF